MAEPVRFVPVRESSVERWSKPQRFDFLRRLPTAPIADTELLHLSHYCPIVIERTDDGPSVRVLLDPDMTGAPPIDKEGRWRPRYSPIALRTLPFWPGEPPEQIAVAPELFEAEHEGFALRDSAGKPSEQFALIVASINRLRQGMTRLDRAAKVLIAADLLTPLLVDRAGEPSLETCYLTLSMGRFRMLAPEQAAALSVDHCLPLDLAAACAFSQRLLATEIGPRAASEAPPRKPQQHAGHWTDLVDPFEIDLTLDSSQLFSFEAFRNAGTA